MRVSTAGTQAATLSQLRSVQSALADATEQSSSGLISSSYSGVASNSYLISTLTAEISESEDYTDLAEQIEGRIEVYYDNLNDMVDVLASVLSDLSGAVSSGSDSTTGINSSAQSALETLADLLNTQYEGRYLYGGSDTTSAPVSVDTADYAAITTVPSTTDLSYYSGNSDVATAKVDDDTTIEYGITADEDAFEEALRALNIAANASEDPVDEDALNEAISLIESATDGISDLLTSVSYKQDQLENIISSQESFQNQAEETLSGLTEVDIAEAVVTLNTLSVQLEATYSISAQLADMTLFDYLK